MPFGHWELFHTLWFKEKGRRCTCKIIICLKFSSVFGDWTSFRAKGLRGWLELALFTSVFCDRTSFRAKGFPDDLQIALFSSVFSDRTSFRAKGLRRTWNRNCTSVFFVDRTSFRAKRLCFAPSRWHGPCCRLEKRNRKEERARGENVDVRRCEKMWEDVRRCEKMWRWEDVKMRRCEDEKMRRRWEDEEKMRRWGEDVRMKKCDFGNISYLNWWRFYGSVFLFPSRAKLNKQGANSGKQ